MPSCKVLLRSLILFLVAGSEVFAYQHNDIAQGQSAPSVTIASTRNPVDKSYRAMVDGMSLFEKNRHLSPQASLRYKLLPRDFDVDMSTIKLKVVGDTFSYPVAIADDQTFTLDVQDKALKEDASVRPNRRADSMTWRVEIKTPGLPQHVRRLGDLRLECRVGVAARLVSTRGNNPVGSISDSLCMPISGRSGYYFFADKPIFNVVLRYETRSMNLPLSYLYSGLANSFFTGDLSDKDSRAIIGRTYFLPLGDRSWPDDTLVEFEYMEEPSSSLNMEQQTSAGARL